MQSVTELFHEQIEVKKSTFIGYLTPLSQIDTLYERLKEEHPKARHIVWAKRYLNEYQQIVENSSDDGEPKGTSGPPVLNVMRGSNLIECAILIVRYFGGIKLGTGGLVRAYSSCAKAVIDRADLQLFEARHSVRFFTRYTLVARFEHFLKHEGIPFPKREYEGEGIVWELNLSERESASFLAFASSYERDGFHLMG
ncbi:IMPACT family protein [Sulfurospirillum sp. 1612]|uniref:IMPACT family protein n=1 Tax=Sulfurospirillum sp. 1612 TaxID=3094835 RepID=UPI002F952B4A